MPKILAQYPKTESIDNTGSHYLGPFGGSRYSLRVFTLSFRREAHGQDATKSVFQQNHPSAASS